MAWRHNNQRGIALITTLFVSTLLLVLGIAFLTYLERDYRFAATQSRSQEALYLALSGVEYAKIRPDQVPVGGREVTKSVPKTNAYRYFTVQVLADGTLSSTGVVWSGPIKVSKTVTVRPGESPRRYLESGI